MSPQNLIMHFHSYLSYVQYMYANWCLSQINNIIKRQKEKEVDADIAVS